MSGGGRGTRTHKGVNPAVFKTAALPIRSSPPLLSEGRPAGVGLALHARLWHLAEYIPRGRERQPHRQSENRL